MNKTILILIGSFLIVFLSLMDMGTHCLPSYNQVGERTFLIFSIPECVFCEEPVGFEWYDRMDKHYSCINNPTSSCIIENYEYETDKCLNHSDFCLTKTFCNWDDATTLKFFEYQGGK